MFTYLSSFRHLSFDWLKRCFTSTETVGLLGTVAQDGHLDLHTVPELRWCEFSVAVRRIYYSSLLQTTSVHLFPRLQQHTAEFHFDVMIASVAMRCKWQNPRSGVLGGEINGASSKVSVVRPVLQDSGLLLLLLDLLAHWCTQSDQRELSKHCA